MPAERRGDRELVSAYAAGDRDAFAELYVRHRERVFCIALGMLRDREAALDVTQDVFCRLVRTLATFDGSAAFTTWLHRVALNACYDVLRRRAPEPSADPYADPGAHEPSADPDPAARLDTLAALERLTPDHRAVVVLHDMVGYRYDEIADLTGIAVGTVKSRLARARMRLAALLVEGSFDPGNSTGGVARQRGGDSRG